MCPNACLFFSVFSEDISQMTYLSCFLKEVLRYHSPAPVVSRMLHEPMEIGGVEFPKGSIFDLGMYSVHHNPDVWDKHWVS